MIWKCWQMDGVDGRRGALTQHQAAHYHHQSNGGGHFNSAGSAGSANSAGMMYSPPHSGYPPLPFPMSFSANFPLPLALPFGSPLNNKHNWVRIFQDFSAFSIWTLLKTSQKIDPAKKFSEFCLYFGVIQPKTSFLIEFQLILMIFVGFFRIFQDFLLELCWREVEESILMNILRIMLIFWNNLAKNVIFNWISIEFEDFCRIFSGFFIWTLLKSSQRIDPDRICDKSVDII